MRGRIGFVVMAAVAGVLVEAPSLAAHHLWKLTEIFSNASGSVQYVQLLTSDATETNVGGFTVTASGGTFTFASNLTGSTANKWILLATSSFASVPHGVPPDGIIPPGFLSTGGGTIDYASGTDVWSYGAVPTDGVRSLMRDGTTPVNSATNFAGATGSVNLSAAAPALPGWAIVAGIGTLLLAGSGLLRARQTAGG
ncbi:MAG TPA: hypothetical protein VE987_14145 [Polyangiaceae bacterium]|nr:hypothetical protein [Polyangiaceae bacterium]